MQVLNLGRSLPFRLPFERGLNTVPLKAFFLVILSEAVLPPTLSSGPFHRRVGRIPRCNSSRSSKPTFSPNSQYRRSGRVRLNLEPATARTELFVRYITTDETTSNDLNVDDPRIPDSDVACRL